MLNKAVMYRATELITLYSHERSNGRSCFTVLDEFGVTIGCASENIAYGSTSESIVKA